LLHEYSGVNGSNHNKRRVVLIPYYIVNYNHHIGTAEAKNFRGITLNNILPKIYSKVLIARLTKWTDKNSVLIDNQYGFQK
jgi:hypothetical protein